MANLMSIYQRHYLWASLSQKLIRTKHEPNTRVNNRNLGKGSKGTRKKGNKG
jgi:hypothetical protein